MKSTTNYAGFWLRLPDAIIDGIILTIGSNLVKRFIPSNSSNAIPNPQNVAEFRAYLIATGASILLAWLYYALMESSAKQASLGKMIVGIAVTDLQGNRDILVVR